MPHTYNVTKISAIFTLSLSVIMNQPPLPEGNITNQGLNIILNLSHLIHYYVRVNSKEASKNLVKIYEFFYEPKNNNEQRRTSMNNVSIVALP